jgi:hypothetical protein
VHEFSKRSRGGIREAGSAGRKTFVEKQRLQLFVGVCICLLAGCWWLNERHLLLLIASDILLLVHVFQIENTLGQNSITNTPQRFRIVKYFTCQNLLFNKQSLK